MKVLLKGLLYAASLIFINRAILAFDVAVAGASVFVFFVTGVLFLVTDRIEKLFATGFSALVFLFFGELTSGLGAFSAKWFECYVYGLFGTMAAVVVAIVLTCAGKGEKKIEKRRRVAENMEKNDKVKLLAYFIVTALSFPYLVLAEGAGIGVLIFALLQAVMLFFIIPDKKRLVLFVPAVVLMLNSFISGSDIFDVANFFICGILYSLMFTRLDVRKVGTGFITELFERMIMPVETVSYPFEWAAESGFSKNARTKRILIGAGCGVVTAVILCAVLSGADMVFGQGVSTVLENFGDVFTVKGISKLLCGIIVALYLFGVVAAGFEKSEEREVKSLRGDMIIITSVLVSALVVYTIFAFIQFRYLFSGDSLPFGLNVQEYARKGFFELLALSVVNIGAILIVTALTRHIEGKKLVLVKSLNSYLCAVTMVLLASSWYRMWLYNQADGLTRLRFMVFGFLVFEAIGLIVTFFYIIKPQFNIVMVYGSIALLYYMLLNVVPMDLYVARSQADRYLDGDRNEVEYVMTLSSDAASEVERIYENTDNPQTKHKCKRWFSERREEYNENKNWQKYNLSLEGCLMDKDCHTLEFASEYLEAD